jgi:hypothetical protein
VRGRPERGSRRGGRDALELHGATTEHDDEPMLGADTQRCATSSGQTSRKPSRSCVDSSTRRSRSSPSRALSHAPIERGSPGRSVARRCQARSTTDAEGSPRAPSTSASIAACTSVPRTFAQACTYGSGSRCSPSQTSRDRRVLVTSSGRAARSGRSSRSAIHSPTASVVRARSRSRAHRARPDAPRPRRAPRRRRVPAPASWCLAARSLSRSPRSRCRRRPHAPPPRRGRRATADAWWHPSRRAAACRPRSRSRRRARAGARRPR